MVLQIHNKGQGVRKGMWHRRKRSQRVGHLALGRSCAHRRRRRDHALSRGRHDRHQVLQQNNNT